MAMAAGIALTGRDGSLPMNPAGPIAVGAARDLPIIHIVLNDGQYDSTGGQPTSGNPMDLAGLAGSCGFPDVQSAATHGDLFEAAEFAVTHGSSPMFVLCLVARTRRHRHRARPNSSPTSPGLSRVPL